MWAKWLDPVELGDKMPGNQRQEGPELVLRVANREAGAAEGETAGVGDGGAAALEDALADREAEAAAACLGGELRGEEFREMLLIHSGAVVFEDYLVEARIGAVPQRNKHLRTADALASLDGVVQDVHEHTDELRARAVDDDVGQAEVLELDRKSVV